MKNKPLWQPNYTITPATASGLMEIAAARTVVEQVPLSVAVQAELRRRASVRSTHYSTRIEGNRLTLSEAQAVIEERRTMFRGRESGTWLRFATTGMRSCAWRNGQQRMRH